MIGWVSNAARPDGLSNRKPVANWARNEPPCPAAARPRACINLPAEKKENQSGVPARPSPLMVILTYAHAQGKGIVMVDAEDHAWRGRIKGQIPRISHADICVLYIEMLNSMKRLQTLCAISCISRAHLGLGRSTYPSRFVEDSRHTG